MDKSIKIKNVSEPKQELTFYIRTEEGQDVLVKLSHGEFIYSPEQETRHLKVYNRKNLITIELEDVPRFAEMYRVYTDGNLYNQAETTVDNNSDNYSLIDSRIDSFVEDIISGAEKENSIVELLKEEIDLNKIEELESYIDLEKIEQQVEKYQGESSEGLSDSSSVEEENKKSKRNKKGPGRPKKRGPKPKKKPIGRPKKKINSKKDDKKGDKSKED